MSEIKQYMLDCPECGASINVHPDALDYMFGESESGCNGLYEFDRDICLCPRCRQRFVRVCEYLPVPRTYTIFIALHRKTSMNAILDCPYCGKLMDVSEDKMESVKNLDHGWYRVGVFGSEDVCKCPHCSGKFIREIEYDLRVVWITVGKETD